MRVGVFFAEQCEDIGAGIVGVGNDVVVGRDRLIGGGLEIAREDVGERGAESGEFPAGGQPVFVRAGLAGNRKSV